MIKKITYTIWQTNRYLQDCDKRCYSKQIEMAVDLPFFFTKLKVEAISPQSSMKILPAVENPFKMKKITAGVFVSC